MMAIILHGDGVLSGVWDRDEMERLEEAEAAEAIKREMREIVAAAQEEKVNQALGELEAELIKVVRAELAEELAARKTPAKTLASYKKHLAAFRSWCESYPLPHNPPHPVAVAAFLGHMATTGATLSEVKRAAAAIAHRNRLADVTNQDDALVAAVLRYLAKTIKNRRQSPPKKKEK